MRTEQIEEWSIALKTAICLCLVLGIIWSGQYVYQEYKNISYLNNKVKIQQICLDYADYSNLETVEASNSCFKIIQEGYTQDMEE